MTASDTETDIIDIPKINLRADWKNGLLIYMDENFYNKKIADTFFSELLKSITYDKNSSVKIFGKTIPIPRKQTAFGDPGTTYTFSGMTVKAKKWIPILSTIKKHIEGATGKKFNFCLVNYYENGSKYIGYHKDDEDELGDAPWIVSLSFGQERKFYLKSDNPKLPIVKMKLPHGSMCIMMHPTNVYWKHSVPKESVNNCPNPRINLTFRYIDNSADSNPVEV
ncbi:putative alpha-ketoglutarate-dependent dioxygenase alkB-like 2-like [Tupanvirus deep ocean]|uniref:Alpha-ketoglutarate-dependent dioxygenase alkB-like 2-like n=2 Tax=Tupanvirus TaxID=2094720 RepID=A0AC62A899_9VIRU|nr:putative alpha-ketoglutarate-dependent dioxygenase alkB-like 2-like [Tupanvirus deep ocean]QKU33962.1 putative alpha-ketoglutarate-dependent dioxygenase alkB-like 2-like [Tupanvirus deep ocean]